MTDQPTFEIYQFEISITLHRKDGAYNSTNLVKFSTEQEKPLTNDDAARNELVNMVNEACNTSRAIVDERILFENRTKALTRGGETIDA